MITLKCKSCGASIQLVDNERYAECDYCGNVFDVPLDEKAEQCLNLYCRADDAWDHKDFEEASDLYQQILNIDNTQAQAHFGLVLCKYGITYEIDPVTQKKMPTCNRINRESILADKHYAAAIKYASKESAASFQQRAQEIERISRDFLKIVDKEEPYDVFISYKRTAEDGSLTMDSSVARKLYFHLRDKGMKVFFAEETLKSVGGEKYEPYIFAALSSSPVMVLVGSKREHFEATWVKNEWRRYLALMNQGLKKTLIPVYFDMDPYHMPGELRTLQAMNAKDYTFHEDVTEIIRKKVADTDRAPTQAKTLSLRDKYAPKDKVDKLVDLTDCDREFAINVLVQCYGDVKKSQEFITQDPDYQKKCWICVECKANNTHEKCHKCGISKKESLEVERARRAMEEKELKRSEEYREKRRSNISCCLSALFWISAIAALIYFLIWPKLIKPNLSNDDLYTPEILQTYSGTYNSGNAFGIITFEACDKSGNVEGTFEFVKNNSYGKYKISGAITSKKNKGTLKINIKAGDWIIQPDGFEPLEEMTVKISKKYTTLTCSQYDMSWSTGVDDEYAIKTPEDFKKLSGSEGFYQIKNDIDLSGVDWTPIDGFTGTLLGNGFTVKNLTVETNASNVGMFSTLSGFVNDLNIENANITVSGRNENIGILCGTLTGNISNISVSGTVDASKCNNVGGIIGYSENDTDVVFTDMTSSAGVSGLNNVGGLAGYISAGYKKTGINACINSGTVVSAEDYAGGLVGYHDSDTRLQVYDCENTGDVTARYYVGGLFGYASSDNYSESVIDNSVCKADITGEAYAGCIAGKLVEIPLSNCVNEGSTLTVTGAVLEDEKRCAYAGGFVGCGAGAIDCTNEVEIQYTGGGNYVGGIMGCSEIDSYDVENVLFKNVTNNALVTGADYVGGIVGFTDYYGVGLQIEAAVNTANVSGSGDYVSGVVGYAYVDSYSDYITIYDSENSANINGKAYVGGIVGYGMVKNSEGSVITGCTTTVGKIAGELENIVLE